ncbi:DUF5590 domain-containing protein [Liquorilactobacillus capillatus]|uniref:Cell wall elongation regulator TseB-like domain-containing protein n=1 Tax=Liquorilactobacillus capillatus DSM 19910 TaxID=1423731 RepID=A0A0R1LWQ3_9LACO|nr:DUF5590 domain-containing protein [Liquorilactobacillus capillatus]KRL00063.1 hypothetical protein FC81_GL000440 [Liquorilactobacillus capillatus DSM 19910]
MKRKNYGRSRLRKIMVFAMAVIIIFGTFIIYTQLTAPKKEARSEATTLARKYAKLKTVKNFYWYNRQRTYFTVTGQNTSGQDVYVVIAQKGGQINIYSHDKGIDEQKARTIVQRDQQPRKITKVAMGMWQKKPVWEVTYLNKYNNLCYDLISFKDGSLVKTIQNI